MLERVLWPRGRRTVTARPVAPRLSTLAGKTIGQLWDDLFRGDEIFPMLEAALAQRYPGVKFVELPRRSAPPTAATSTRCSPRCRRACSELGVDAVISGMAC